MQKQFRQPQRTSKQNQSKLLNKKTDLLSSFNNIKLPLFPSNASNISHSSKQAQFFSVPVLQSLQSKQVDKVIPKRKQQESIKGTLSMTNKIGITLTQEYCLEYGDGAKINIKQAKGKFLNNHKIDAVLRARMLDWMVQVMSSYNFQNKTYFTGVSLMDRFFSSCSETIIPAQLHIIGIQSMFIATKMQQVYPLKMKTVYDKIGHKKISIPELLSMEQKILQCLNFNLLSQTFFDICLSKISNHLSALSLFSNQLMQQLEELVACLGKFACYSYDLLVCYDSQIIGMTLANCALDIYKIERVGRLSVEEIQCKQMVIDCMISFKRKFKGLGNIFKFSNKKMIEIVQRIGL